MDNWVEKSSEIDEARMCALPEGRCPGVQSVRCTTSRAQNPTGSALQCNRVGLCRTIVLFRLATEKAIYVTFHLCSGESSTLGVDGIIVTSRLFVSLEKICGTAGFADYFVFRQR